MKPLPAQLDRRPHGQRHDGHGFTLVEVLVALVVLALMAGLAWRGVDGIVRTRDASQRQLEQTLRLNTVIAQWEADLAAVQDTGAVPPLQFDGATLRLTRKAAGGVQVVAWTVQPSPAGSPWLRWAGPVVTSSASLQESWFASQQLQGSEATQLHVLEGLTQWQLYYFQSDTWSNAQSSGNAAAPAASGTTPTARTQAQALPGGVRLVLSFAPGSGLNGTLTRDTLMGPG